MFGNFVPDVWNGHSCLAGHVYRMEENALAKKSSLQIRGYRKKEDLKLDGVSSYHLIQEKKFGNEAFLYEIYQILQIFKSKCKV